MNVHFSSKTDEWETPQSTFDALDQEFHFVLDVCASQENAKCPRYFTREQDGLKQPWCGACWMNPPYGREIGKSIAKAANTARSGLGTVVCLLPARTDTRWWHEYCAKPRIIADLLQLCVDVFPNAPSRLRALHRRTVASSRPRKPPLLESDGAETQLTGSMTRNEMSTIRERIGHRRASARAAKVQAIQQGANNADTNV